MEKSSYIIGSGWWCDNQVGRDGREKFYGSDEIRGKDFHRLWYKAVTDTTEPLKIIIIDSASPVRPDLNREDERLEFVSLPFNPGHSTNHLGKYSGWVRSVILGLEYAMASDVDYFVYVEQDALLSGRGIVEACVSKMKTPYMFGSGEGTPQLLQQSFFIIKRNGMRRFVDRLHRIKSMDRHISPEDKFYIASSKYPVWLVECFFKALRKKRSRKKRASYNFILKKIRGFDDLPFGYGRARPIVFNDGFYYFQHASNEELEAHTNRHVRYFEEET